MKSKFETYGPYIAGLLLGVVFAFLIPFTYIYRSLTLLPQSLITISAIMTGFVAAYKGLLPLLEDKKALQRVISRNKLPLFISFIDRVIWGGLLLSFFSIFIMLFISESCSIDICRILFGLWVGLISFLLICFAQVSAILNNVLTSDE